MRNLRSSRTCPCGKSAIGYKYCSAECRDRYWREVQPKPDYTAYVADVRRFVTTWQESSSVRDAAMACGMDARGASNFAAHLRRSGVMLKRMPNRGNQDRKKSARRLSAEDVEELRVLVENLETAREVGKRYRGA